jgi:hypothetical protein
VLDTKTYCQPYSNFDFELGVFRISQPVSYVSEVDTQKVNVLEINIVSYYCEIICNILLFVSVVK